MQIVIQPFRSIELRRLRCHVIELLSPAHKSVLAAKENTPAPHGLAYFYVAVHVNCYCRYHLYYLDRIVNLYRLIILKITNEKCRPRV